MFTLTQIIGILIGAIAVAFFMLIYPSLRHKKKKSSKESFEKPVKGVSPQYVKKLNDIGEYIMFGLVFIWIIILILGRIPLNLSVPIVLGIVSIGCFYKAFLGIKYQMVGILGAFPTISGPYAKKLSYILIILGLIAVYMAFKFAIPSAPIYPLE